MSCPWRQQLPSQFLSQGQAASLPSSRSSTPVGSSRRSLPLKAQSADTEESLKARGKQPRQSLFPGLENLDEGAEAFLPVRQPGSFPGIRVRSFWDRVTVDLWEGADEKFTSKKAAGGFDPLRDGPLRYLGYSNECGEAFAAWLPFWGVPFSYAVAVSYVLVDTADKGWKALTEAQEELDGNNDVSGDVDLKRLEKILALERATDTVIWQLLASVICPGYTIHTVVHFAHVFLQSFEDGQVMRQAVSSAAHTFAMQEPVMLSLVDRTLPTLAGLAAIPFIVHPIDNAIHVLMNLSIRPAMRKYVCGPGQGCLANLEMCEYCKVEDTDA